jgi:hypothetical protein
MMSELEKYSEGRILLASCKTDEISYEMPNEGHGAFTYFFIKGLEGDADINKDSLISAKELSDFTFNKVSRWSRKNLLKQTPRLKADISGDFLLAKVKTPEVENANKIEPIAKYELPPETNFNSNRSNASSTLVISGNPNSSIAAIIENGGDSPPFLNVDFAKKNILYNLGKSDTIGFYLGDTEQKSESNHVTIKIIREKKVTSAKHPELGASKNVQKARENLEKNQRKSNNRNSKSVRKAQENVGKQEGIARARLESSTQRDKRTLPINTNKSRRLSGSIIQNKFTDNPAKLILLKEAAISLAGNNFSTNIEIPINSPIDQIKFRLYLINNGIRDFRGDIIVLDNLALGLEYNGLINVYEVKTKLSDTIDNWSFSSINYKDVGMTAVTKDNIIKYTFSESYLKSGDGLAIEFAANLKFSE